MEKTKSKKSLKIVVPTMVVVAILGAILGGLTGVAVVFGIGVLGLFVTLAAAMLTSRKDRKRHADSHSR